MSIARAAARRAPSHSRWSVSGKHLVTRRLEFGTRFPGWPHLVGGYPYAEAEQQAEVINCTGEVPVRLHVIRDIVIVVVGVLIALGLAVVIRLADEVRTG